MKKLAISTVGTFVAWQIMDYVIHGKILMATYAATSELWRPMAEMKNGLMMVVAFISALTLSLVYKKLVSEKNVSSGIYFGLVLGIGTGISMGYGSYAYMPIPYSLAMGWFLANVAKMVVAGAVIGYVFNDD